MDVWSSLFACFLLWFARPKTSIACTILAVFCLLLSHSLFGSIFFCDAFLIAFSPLSQNGTHSFTVAVAMFVYFFGQKGVFSVNFISILFDLVSFWFAHFIYFQASSRSRTQSKSHRHRRLKMLTLFRFWVEIVLFVQSNNRRPKSLHG